MVKGKYRIRKNSIAWHIMNQAKTLSLLLLFIGILLAFLLASKVYANATEIKTYTENDTAREIEVEPKHYNVPLSDNLQAYIISKCEDDIEPELVFAIIQRESNFNADAIGDNGTSFGLMQVREMYHEKRMENLGCTDLLNPYENIVVGIDILREKLNKYDTVEEALTAYNAGDAGAYELYFSKGIKANDYALEVIEIANTL